MGLNLQFTQKDAPIPKHQDKGKRNGHVHDPKTVAPFPRVNSGIHPTAKDQKRPHGSNHKHSDAKQKAGFTISSPGEDEDEWVSSEAGSGAATPDDSSDEEEPRRERSKTPVKETKAAAPVVEKDGVFLSATPRAESSMSRIATARPAASLEASQFPPPVQHTPAADFLNQQSTKQFSHQRQHTEPTTMMSRSINTSPTQHYRHDSSKRNSMTRPPSVHSIRSEVPLRPHPLIRGNSYGQGVALGSAAKPAPLAPLTVTSSSSAAQISSSPPNSSSSPTSIKTSFGPQSPNRRTSISSARSVATLPITPMSPEPQGKQHQDRNRTISTMSSSSTFAALTSLAYFPTTTSRPTTPQYTSHFPQQHNSQVNLDIMHPLLPPPYLGAHLTVLATKNPVRESFSRVARAKQGM